MKWICNGCEDSCELKGGDVEPRVCPYELDKHIDKRRWVSPLQDPCMWIPVEEEQGE